jgi:hypothetical protein
LVENKKAQLVVIAHDVDPIEVGLTCFDGRTELSDVTPRRWRRFHAESGMLKAKVGDRKSHLLI